MSEQQLQAFLDEAGRVTRWPSKRDDQTMILRYLAGQFETGQNYTEREVNEVLNRYHTFGDAALLRREIYELGYMNRTADGSAYWRTPNTTFF